MVLGRLSTLGILAILLPGCSEVGRGAADHFIAGGEMIALSGGDGGARNACIACHGADGRGNGAGTPRLAGLDRGYMTAQLEAYATGRRQHTEMEAIASKLTQTQQDAVSAYYAAMPFAASSQTSAAAGKAQTLYHKGDMARGIAACASCHGERGEGVGPANPPLGGQPAAYLAEQIDQWRASRRRNDPQNVMLTISQALTEGEITSLASYSASLPGDPLRPESLEAFPAAHRGGPRSGASALQRHAGE